MSEAHVFELLSGLGTTLFILGWLFGDDIIEAWKHRNEVKAQQQRDYLRAMERIERRAVETSIKKRSRTADK